MQKAISLNILPECVFLETICETAGGIRVFFCFFKYGMVLLPSFYSLTRTFTRLSLRQLFSRL